MLTFFVVIHGHGSYVAGGMEIKAFRMCSVVLHIMWISSFVRIFNKELLLLLEINQNKWKWT